MYPVVGPRRIRALATIVLAGIIAIPTSAAAQNNDIWVAIAKHASLTSDGSVVIRIHIACDPLPGFEEFQEGYAGAGQERTGASGETGIDGMVVCDGEAHTHTARVFPFEGAFERGPAGANASVFICNLLGDEQHCIAGSASRRIIIRGRTIP